MFPFRSRSQSCEHTEVRRTVLHGLVRTVCGRCGVVHIAAQDPAAPSPLVAQPLTGAGSPTG